MSVAVFVYLLFVFLYLWIEHFGISFQLMSPNSTGILIDIYQVSWIGELVICILEIVSWVKIFHEQSFGDLSLCLYNVHTIYQ